MVWRMVDVDVRKEIQRLLASEMPHGAISAMARHLQIEAASVSAWKKGHALPERHRWAEIERSRTSCSSWKISLARPPRRHQARSVSHFAIHRPRMRATVSAASLSAAGIRCPYRSVVVRVCVCPARPPATFGATPAASCSLMM